MGKIGPFVGIGDEIGLVVGIGPVVGIGLFGGTGLVVSLTYISQISGERLQDHWSSSNSYRFRIHWAIYLIMEFQHQDL